MSRPEVKIEWEDVDKLLRAGCLGTEVAAYFGIHPNTFYRRVEEQFNISFSEYLQQKRSKGDALIRLQQFEKALGLSKKGDNMMLIWLGKNRLGQKDSKDSDEQADKSITLKVNFDGNSVQILPPVIPASDSTSSQ